MYLTVYCSLYFNPVFDHVNSLTQNTEKKKKSYTTSIFKLICFSEVKRDFVIHYDEL